MAETAKHRIPEDSVVAADSFSPRQGQLLLASRCDIQLPLFQEILRTGAPQSSTQAGTRRILIIEDQDDDVDSLRESLLAAGHAVLVAGTAEFALALAREFEPDAVIVDIGLPGMDAFEVAKRLREQQATGDIVLIAISGFNLTRFSDLSDCEHWMFRHYLVKPASAATILTIVSGPRPPN